MELFNPLATSISFLIPNETGYSFRYDDKIKGYHIEIPNGELIFIEQFFDASESKIYLDELTDNRSNLPFNASDWNFMKQSDLSEISFTNIQWQQDQIKLFGKTVAIPRFSAWYGENDVAYTYSGLTLKAKPWNESLLSIKNKIEAFAGEHYNSVLLNWYRNGMDSMGWHADDEKELGENPIIASLNFGATRQFVLRSKANKNSKIKFNLSNGSLLIMKGALQHHWQHSIPKATTIKDGRINLTFRKIVQ
jgi:alkylated DNA repair dioxygenase AlkB